MPRIKSITEVDKPWGSIQDIDWKLGFCCEKLGWFLMRIHTITKRNVWYSMTVLFPEVIWNGFIILCCMTEGLKEKKITYWHCSSNWIQITDKTQETLLFVHACVKEALTECSIKLLVIRSFTTWSLPLFSLLWDLWNQNTLSKFFSKIESTDFHFAKYRFSFCKVQILFCFVLQSTILQSTISLPFPTFLPWLWNHFSRPVFSLRYCCLTDGSLL